MYFIFDVDGTLTPSRGKINFDFEKYFKPFILKYPVALVTGSDLEKTVEQLGSDIVKSVEYSFNCSGNAIYQRNSLIHKSILYQYKLQVQCKINKSKEISSYFLLHHHLMP